nr:hypothetical protein [Kibdelosporangium sp. MJ126-NF4]
MVGLVVFGRGVVATELVVLGLDDVVGAVGLGVPLDVVAGAVPELGNAPGPAKAAASGGVDKSVSLALLPAPS